MLILSIVLTIGVSFGGATNAKPLEQLNQHYWRNPRRCGVNCLYAYLRLHGSQIQMSELITSIPIGEKGSSLKALKDASRLGHFDSMVVKTTPHDIQRFSLPAIAHIDSREGHYVLILRAGTGNVTVADMTSGKVETKSLDLFAQNWSGYLLVPQTQRNIWLNPISYGVALIIAAFAFLLLPQLLKFNGSESGKLNDQF